MYLFKRLQVAAPTTPSVSLDDWIDFFDFQRHLYPHVAASEWTKADKVVLDDYAASTVRRLFEKGMLVKDELIRNCLKCCRDILLFRGYSEPSHSDSLPSQIDMSPTNLVLVLGCQTQELLESRGNKAVALIRKLPGDLTVVLSGENPGDHVRRRVRIPHEAIRLRGYLEARLRSEWMRLRVVLERFARNTQDNLVRSINAIESPGPITLYVVTSTFHLLRVAKEIQSLTIAAPEAARRIGDVVLAGAEYVPFEQQRIPKVCAHPAYFKQLFRCCKTALDEIENEGDEGLLVDPPA